MTRRYFCQREPWLWDGCRIHVRQFDVVGERARQYNIVSEQKLVECQEGDDISEPLLRLEAKDAQELFDSMWAAGYRPNKGEASAAHVEAMKYHMEDLRRLVFKGKP